ncbi:Hsp20/alpha crystallin family protein [Anaerosphaera multitolerans]|uniref:Hsp20/alpha crystallin family protein n=1 Tax=Anaerosphaera multitolerans TaxID=2487351 RepID=A0A437S9A6_9FIRM|nr:Hsp20/alpha crystallin family protein [Anaerosphaera multitolerans]RVU55582.1 Hsp20/alpha crystallin family protein [Anaerosphaera multitolerans]
MTNLRPFRRNSLVGFDRDFEDFYNMIDNFFNDDFIPERAMKSGSFKVDISEDEKEYKIEAELPGFEKGDIEVTLDDGRLTIVAEKTEEKDESDEAKNYIHKERRSTKMQRMMYFKDIDEEGLKANLDKGLLVVTVPKKTEVITKKKIEIE